MPRRQCDPLASYSENCTRMIISFDYANDGILYSRTSKQSRAKGSSGLRSLFLRISLKRQ